MRWTPYVVLFVFVLIFFRAILFVPGYAIPWDFRGYHLPIAWFAASSLANGEMPLWDASVYCGRPLYANLTTQLFYPPTLLALVVNNFLAPGESATLLYTLEWQLALHVFAAGCFAFRLARELGLDRAAALAAAIAFQGGAFFASQAQHLGAVNAASYLPLAWWAVLRMEQTGSRRYWVVLALALALVFLAGFPAVTSAVFGMTLVFAACRGRLLGAMTALGAALAVSAVQLLPTLELTRLSVAKYRMDWMGTGGGLPLGSLISLVSPNHFGVFDLKTFRQPFNPTFLYLYGGLTVLGLAAAALWKRPAFTWQFTFLTAAAGLWMLGDSTPLGRTVFPALPDFLKSAIYLEFAMAVFSLSLAVLAGLGAGTLPARWRKAAVAAVALDLIAVSSSRPINTASLVEEPGIGNRHFDGRPEILAKMRELTGAATPPYRIDTVSDTEAWVMGAPMTGVPTASGNDPFALEAVMRARLQFVKGERWGRYYEVADLGSPMLDFENVRYVLSREPIAEAMLEKTRFRKAAELPGRIVYENLEAQPRFQVSPAEGSPVRVIEYRNNRVKLEVTAGAAGRLVTSEAAYPGWRAFVDGAERALELEHGAFRALAVPEGRHTVEMRFEPVVLRYGAMISAAALALLAVVWIKAA